jgi:hypothetical protein
MELWSSAALGSPDGVVCSTHLDIQPRREMPTAIAALIYGMDSDAGAGDVIFNQKNIVLDSLFSMV